MSSVCKHGFRVEACRTCLPNGSTVNAFVRLHPDGASIEEIAAVLGVSKQAVDKILHSAFVQLGGTGQYKSIETRAVHNRGSRVKCANLHVGKGKDLGPTPSKCGAATANRRKSARTAP